MFATKRRLTAMVLIVGFLVVSFGNVYPFNGGTSQLFRRKIFVLFRYLEGKEIL